MNEIRVLEPNNKSLPERLVNGDITIQHLGNDGLLNPALSYLLTLRSKRSVVTAKAALNAMAKIFGYVDLHEMPWETLNADTIGVSLHSLRMTESEILDSSYAKQTFIDDVRARQISKRKRWEPKALKTANLYLSMIKGVMRQAFLKGQISSEVFTRIKEVKGYSLDGESNRALPVTALNALSVITMCKEENSCRGARDAAALALLYGCGLRRDETRRLKLSDINWDEGTISFEGKGNKRRKPPLHAWQLPILKHWIENHRPEVPGALLLPITRWDKVELKLNNRGEAIAGSDNLIYRIVKARFVEAGYPVIAPHDLRHVFATALLDNNTSFNELSLLLGHKSNETTRIYDRTGFDRARKSAIKNLPGL